MDNAMAWVYNEYVLLIVLCIKNISIKQYSYEIL